jgi:hypothetical protein
MRRRLPPRGLLLELLKSLGARELRLDGELFVCLGGAKVALGVVEGG